MQVSWTTQKPKTSELRVKKVPEKPLLPREVVHALLPKPPFCLPIVAPRESGKTNLLVDLLLDRNKFFQFFEIIFIWSKSFFHDSKWRNLKLPFFLVNEHFDVEQVQF